MLLSQFVIPAKAGIQDDIVDATLDPGSRRFAAADSVRALFVREPEGANREEQLAASAG